MEHIGTLKEEHLDECARLMVSTFNAKPWNAKYTFETAEKELTWTLAVPGFLGFASFDDGVVAFAVGYVEQDDEREVFCLRTCV